MIAIPKKLLIHEVMLYKKIKTERWGDKTMDDGLLIQKVRMEPSSKIVRDKNSAEIQLAATLFYDCRNSNPRDISFVEDDIILFNGQKHQIKTVEPLYDNCKLHHYELGLVKHA